MGRLQIIYIIIFLFLELIKKPPISFIYESKLIQDYLTPAKTGKFPLGGTPI